ncbi:uncharacterized protein LOC126424031 [Schistocerca serialis cubense]|uniref:uncharacterized protein LOC126424031 n=1 Tax=Schistocerca serialis cubense TaxID=2023355 RepID=UPI00214EE306|nr:uncharacterized protein LOC126424031 [Schistocerca serialis cubense]
MTVCRELLVSYSDGSCVMQVKVILGNHEGLEDEGIKTRYVKLLRQIYDQATMTFRVDEDLITSRVPTGKGVRQDDTVSLKLFNLALEDIFKFLDWNNRGIKINGSFLRTKEYDLRTNTCIYQDWLRNEQNKPFTFGNQSIAAVDEYIYFVHKIKVGKTSEVQKFLAEQD